MIPAACDAYGEELVAYLDGEQPEAERARLEAHLGSCLSCRRELDRLRRLRGLIGELRPIEPSAAFEDEMWRRLDAAPARTTRRRRALLWAAPALAAAAALALTSYALIQRAASERPTAHGAATVARAPRPAASAGAPQLAHRAPEVGGEQRQVASDDLEQYPPELVEHPELFLRYPVVRRLQRLEHFEEVRQHGNDNGGEPLGALTRESPAIG